MIGDIHGYMIEAQDHALRLAADPTRSPVPTSLIRAVQQFHEDVSFLRQCLPDTMVPRLAAKIKFVFQKSKVQEATKRLEESKATAILALCVIGRYVRHLSNLSWSRLTAGLVDVADIGAFALYNQAQRHYGSDWRPGGPVVSECHCHQATELNGRGQAAFCRPAFGDHVSDRDDHHHAPLLEDTGPRLIRNADAPGHVCADEIAGHGCALGDSRSPRAGPSAV